MNWKSFADFAAMGGYGLYVWGSFAMCAVVFAIELLALRQRRRALRGMPPLDSASFGEGASA